MKQLVSMTVFAFAFAFSWAQVGIGTATPNPASVLDINSANGIAFGGVKFPTLTNIQREAIPNPIPEGLMIFNSDERSLQIYNGSSFSWTNIYTINDAPRAIAISISGSFDENQVLTGNYTYSDTESDTEGVSLYRWTRADDNSGANETDIFGANSSTYALVTADVNKFIKFYVTPVATTGFSLGAQVGSSFEGPIDVDLTSDLPYAESFETDGNGSRYFTSISEFTDISVSTGNDYFTRTDGSNISRSITLTGSPDGSYFFAANDINGEGADSQQILTITGINITGETNLQLDVLIAEDDSTSEKWDDTSSNDFVHINYQIDGEGFYNLLWIEASTFNASNSEPSIDADFNGVGDGVTYITNAWTNYNASIPTTGSSLDLRIIMDLDSGDEDIAIDNIRITSN